MTKHEFTTAYRRARKAHDARFDGKPLYPRDFEGGRWAHLWDHAMTVRRSWALVEAGCDARNPGQEWAICLRNCEEVRRRGSVDAVGRWAHARQLRLASAARPRLP